MSTSEGYQALSRGGSYARQKHKFSADRVTYLRGMPDERAQKDQKVSQARQMYHQVEKPAEADERRVHSRCTLVVGSKLDRGMVRRATVSGCSAYLSPCYHGDNRSLFTTFLHLIILQLCSRSTGTLRKVLYFHTLDAHLAQATRLRYGHAYKQILPSR